MSGYEVVTCEVEHLGLKRTVKLIIDRETLVPYFPASVWLIHQDHRKPSGYDALARHIANFLTFLQINKWSPLEITKAELRAYFEKFLFREKGLSARSIQLYHTSIVAFYKGMENLGFVQKAVQITKFVDNRLQDKINLADGIKNSLDPFDLYKKYLYEEDFQALTGSVPTKSARLRRRDELILQVAYQTGCRAAEIVDPQNFSIRHLREGLTKARAKDVRKTDFLHAIVGKGRGEGKPRRIAMPTTLADDILRYVKDFNIPGDIAFCNRNYEPLHKTHPSKLFKKCKDELIKESSDSTPNIGLWIEHRDSRTFHGLRHTYATNYAHKLRERGEKYDLLQERMGHEHFETTKVYIAFGIYLSGDTDERNAALAETSRTYRKKEFEAEEA